MGLITKLKSLLGLDDERSQPKTSDVGVTVEREPEDEQDATTPPETSTESAVKGVDQQRPESTEQSGSAANGEAETEAEPATERTTATEDESERERTAEAAESAESTGETEPASTEQEATDAETAEEETADTEVGDAEAADAEATDAEATDAEATAEVQDEADETRSESVENIKGIGASYAQTLADADVDDIGDLADADAESLAEETGLSAKRISRWIDRAQDY